MGAVSIISGYGGVDLAVEHDGSSDDPLVVLVHSIGQSRGIWHQTVQYLVAAGRQVLTYDLRGHGQSATPKDFRYSLNEFVGDLRAVLATTEMRPVVVGASSGGWIAGVAIGEGDPHAVSGIVMVDSAPWLDEAESKRVTDLFRKHAEGFDTVEEAFDATIKLHPLRTPPSRAAIEARLRRGSDGRLHWSWDPRVADAIDVKEVDARFVQCMSRITAPVLSVRGANSELVRPEASDRLRELAPLAEHVEIPGAGHLVVNEQTDAFNAALLEFLERRAPRTPLQYLAGSEPRVLRDALGCFATGVTIVAAQGGDGALVGLTANSFTSLSLDPPLILVCIAKGAASLSAIEEAERFSINVLHIGQQPASQRFAARGQDRFGSTPHEIWDDGVPVLQNSLASFACMRHAIHDGGDHVILVGRVERVQFEPRRDPLLYFRGKYRRLHFTDVAQPST